MLSSQPAQVSGAEDVKVKDKSAYTVIYGTHNRLNPEYSRMKRTCFCSETGDAAVEQNNQPEAGAELHLCKLCDELRDV